MATFIYPRLRNLEARELIEALSVADAAALERPRDLDRRGLVWAPTGSRVPWAEVDQLRRELRSAAGSCGYEYGAEEPVEATDPQKAALDFAVAQLLFTFMQISHHEAAQAGIWRYLACVVAPELIRWRFLQNGTTSSKRFGGNRVRNFFARLWWRAALLVDPSHEDPWLLIRELGEDELVQITERPNAAAYRPLATQLGHQLLQKHNRDVASRSALMRDVMKRLVRRLPLIRYESMEAPEVGTVIEKLYDESLQVLDTGGRGRQVSMWDVVSARQPPSQAAVHWSRLSVERRHAFLKVLLAEDLEAIRALASSTPCPWGEDEAPWDLLHTLDCDIATLLRALPIAAKIRVASGLGAASLAGWLTTDSAGTWAAEVVPARGRQLVQALPSEWLSLFKGRLGWRTQESEETQLKRTFLRRYNGDWQELLGWMDDDLCRGLLDELAPGVGGRFPRDGLATWLTGREVTVPQAGIMLPAGAGGSVAARGFLAGVLERRRPDEAVEPEGGDRGGADAPNANEGRTARGTPATAGDGSPGVSPDELLEAVRLAAGARAGVAGEGVVSGEGSLNDLVGSLFRDNEGVSSGMLRESTGLSAGQVLRVMQKAIDEGIIERRGARRGARYFLAPS